MVRLRRRRWFQRIALTAMTALLWSQVALAGHAGCLDAAGNPPVPGAMGVHQGHGHDCDPAPAGAALCTAHCSEGDLSADSARVPPVPPLLAGAWLPWFTVAEVVDDVPVVTSAWVDSPPRSGWHRPTAHPAALLLI